MHLSYQRILNKKKQYEYAEKARLNKVANDQHQED